MVKVSGLPCCEPTILTKMNTLNKSALSMVQFGFWMDLKSRVRYPLKYQHCQVWHNVKISLILHQQKNVVTREPQPLEAKKSMQVLLWPVLLHFIGTFWAVCSTGDFIISLLPACQDLFIKESFLIIKIITPRLRKILLWFYFFDLNTLTVSFTSIFVIFPSPLPRRYVAYKKTTIAMPILFDPLTLCVSKY